MLKSAVIIFLFLFKNIVPIIGGSLDDISSQSTINESGDYASTGVYHWWV